MQLLKTAALSAAIGLTALGAQAENLPIPNPSTINAPSTGNGSLTVYAFTSSTSLTVALGLNLDDFLIPAASPPGGRHIDFGILPSWSTAFGATNTGVTFFLAAGDSTATSGSVGRRLAVTADPAATVTNPTNGVVNH